MACRFPFEADFFETLTFMPFCVRRSLDLARVKLSLGAWQSFRLEDRRALRDFRVATATDADAFRERVLALAAAAGFAVPDTADAPPRWREPAVPPDLQSALSALGLALDDPGWAALDDESRYVLFRLAGRDRTDGRLEVACDLLGIGATAHDKAAP